MKKYCITGINPLTREREVVSKPGPLPEQVSILKQEKAKPSKKREYTHLRINVYPVEPERIQFKEQ